MRIPLLAAVACLVLAAGSPPPPPAAPQASESPWMKGLWLLADGAYLRSLDSLQAAASKIIDPEDYTYESLRRVRVMIGGYAPPPPLTPNQEPLSGEAAAKLRRAEAQDALTAIVAAARGTSVVILNRSFGSPRGDAFALEVARALRPLGYNILALEAFYNDERYMKRLEQDGFVRRSPNSDELNDPVLADFVRQTVAAGYKPVAHQETGKQSSSVGPEWPRRWQAQAENLAALAKANPGHKLFVYVDFMQVVEAPMPRSWGVIESMPFRFKKLTGIDPLTVEQTGVTEDVLYRPGREAWALIAPRLRGPSVLKVDGRPFSIGAIARATDLQVVRPRVRFTNGRPDWLKLFGRRPSPVPPSLLPRSGRRLVQAFLAGEAEDAIPVDQVLVEAGKPPLTMMLPRGRIRFAVQDPEPRPTP